MSRNSELVSIVLPVHNGEQFLAQSIESCLNQTHNNIELIIIDDCSTDSSLEIATYYKNQDSRVSVHSNAINLKLPKSLNIGHGLAQGKYVTWTSDDNRFRKCAIDSLLTHLKKTNADLVYAHCDVINNKEDVEGFLNAKSSDHILFENVVGACFLYTKEVFNLVGKYDSNMLLIEDYDFWLRVSKKGKICELPQILYEYRHHDLSLTSRIKTDKEFQKVFNDAKRKMFERLVEVEDLKAPKDILEFLVNGSYDNLYIRKILTNSYFFKDFYRYSSSFKSVNPHGAIQIIINRLVDVILRNPELQNRTGLIYLYRSSPRAMLALPVRRQLALVRKCI